MLRPQTARVADVATQTEVGYLVADSETQTEVRQIPFLVILRAFLLGLFDPCVSLQTIHSLQWLLRGDPRIYNLAGTPCGDLVLDIICYCDCDADIATAHVRDFLVARQARQLTPGAALQWRFLLHVEHCIINRTGFRPFR